MGPMRHGTKLGFHPTTNVGYYPMKLVISNTPPYFLNLDAPTLPAEPVTIDGVEMWRIWCKHCQEWHCHGPGEVHREAYCKNLKSPYRTSGYNLAKAGG